MSEPRNDPSRAQSETRAAVTRHEFDRAEEEQIRVLIRTMRRASWLVLLLPAGQLVADLGVARFEAVLVAFAARLVFAVVSAVLLRQTQHAFERVVSTEGNDVAHMMDALRAQSRYFWLQLGMMLALAVVLSMAGVVLGATPLR